MSRDADESGSADGARGVVGRGTATAPAGLVCMHCGYDLRGLSTTRPCPECGRPILDSVYGTTLHRSTREALGRIAGGFLTIVGSGAVVALVIAFMGEPRAMPLAFGAGGGRAWLPLALTQDRPGFGFFARECALATMAVWATILATCVRGLAPVPATTAEVRAVLRWLTGVLGALGVCALMLRHVDFILDLIPFAILLLDGVASALLLTWAKDLAREVGARRLARVLWILRPLLLTRIGWVLGDWSPHHPPTTAGDALFLAAIACDLAATAAYVALAFRLLRLRARPPFAPVIAHHRT